MESRCLQCLPCENNDLAAPNVEKSSQKSIKNIETKLEVKQFFKYFGAWKHKQVQKSVQNRLKSCYLQLRVHPAAPMVLQGGPEVRKWPPKVLPRCKNGSPRCSRGAKMAPRRSKTMHQGPQMAIPQNTKGPAAEGVALKRFMGF